MCNIRNIVFLVLLGFASKAQTLTENKKDEFTGTQIKRTSWESLCANMSFNSKYRFCNFDGRYYFNMRMMMGMADVFSISEDAKIIFKLENGDTLIIKNTEFTVTCPGCGSVGLLGSGHGIDVSYKITLEQLDVLTMSRPVKVRIYTNDGYVENNIKSINSLRMSKAISLIK